MFLIPAAGSTPLSLIRLARSLHADRPVYSFMFAGLEDGQAPHDSIESMASAYLKEMRTVQKTGPWFVGGHCFGGNPAFELARQLEAAGDPASAVIVLESMPPPGAAVPEQSEID